MAKMRKRTKFSLIALVIAGLAVAGAAVAIGMGAVALLPQMIAFDIAILSAGVAIGAGVAATSFSISGLVSRKRAQAQSADSVAKMATVGLDQTSESQNALIKTKDNSLKAARIFAKASYKLSKFNISPVTYARQRIGTTNKQIKYESKRYVYGLMNDMYSQSGKDKKARKFDKMSQKLDKKMEKADIYDVSAFAPRFHVAAEYYNPASMSIKTDERSSVNFNNYQTAQEAKQLFENSIKERYSDENKRRGATVVTIKSRDNDQIKEVSASTNASELVDNIELLALKDYALTAQNIGIDGFPLMVQTQDYKLDGTKKGKMTTMLIKNESQLNTRINELDEIVNKTTKQTPKAEEEIPLLTHTVER